MEVFEVASDKKIENHRCDQRPDGYLCRYDVPIRQTTFGIEVIKDGKLLARHNFYSEDGVMTVDIRPNTDCDAREEKP